VAGMAVVQAFPLRYAVAVAETGAGACIASCRSSGPRWQQAAQVSMAGVPGVAGNPLRSAARQCRYTVCRQCLQNCGRTSSSVRKGGGRQCGVSGEVAGRRRRWRGRQKQACCVARQDAAPAVVGAGRQRYATT